MSEELRFDPELIAMLSAVMANPESLLRRMPAARPGVDPWAIHGPISTSAASLTRLERHLIQRHREEVAELLREGCKAKLLSAPFRADRFHAASPPMDPGEWSRRVDRSRYRLEPEEGSLFDRLVHGSPSTLTLSDVVRASLCILPDDSTRILLGLCLKSERKYREALTVLDGVLHGPVRGELEPIAWANRGFVLAETQEFDRALMAYRMACSMAQARPEHYCNWFIFAMRQGREEEILESASALNRALEDGSATLVKATEGLAADVETGDWCPTAESRRVVPLLRQELPMVARRLADVIA